MKTTRTIPLAPIRLRAEVSPTDAAQRRVQATIYTGAEMARFDLLDGAYTLRLKMSGADLTRFNSGAPVTKNHSGDLDAVVGVTERGWIENGTALATFRLSARDDLAALWTDIQSGVIRNVSMDVALLQLEDVTEPGGKRALLATKWEPIGLAIVPAGADPGAQMAALANGPTHPCVITGEKMKRIHRCPDCREQLAADYAEPDCPECGVNLEDAAKARDEVARVGWAHKLATSWQLGDTVAQRWIKDGLSRDEMIEAGSGARAARQQPIDGRCDLGEDYDSPGFRTDMMAEGLAARIQRKEPSERGRRYVQFTLADLAYEALNLRGGYEHKMLDPRRSGAKLVSLALHTTSDYPKILGTAVNRVFQADYEAAAPSYRAICAKRDFRDYRAHSFVRLGDYPNLLEVGEDGEITHGTISESAETVTAANYARIYGVTERILVNDDVGAFADLGTKAARRAAAFENALFYTVLQLNSGNGPTLSDGVALFNATHANLGTGVIAVTGVGDGVSKMLKQTGLDGLKLNLEPAVLLTSADRVAVARQFVTQNLRPTQPSEANPFANLTALADANLTAAEPWYLFAAPSANASFVYGYVAGAEGPRIDTRAGWEVLGVEMRVVLAFAVGCIDWRGTYKSTGV